MKIILQTDRLTLRQFEITDSKFILELVNTSGWIEFIGDRNIKTETAAINYLESGPMKSYKENGFGLYLTQTKQGLPIGMCGILKRESLDYPDIGFAFLPEFMGMGYAFEAARATIDYAKDTLKMKTILAITVPRNQKSIRLLEKIGLVFTEVISSPLDNEELMLFRLK